MKNKGILLATFVLLLSAFASAGTVSFTTTGTFASSGTSTSKTGVSFSGVTFVGSDSNNNVSFGNFTTPAPGTKSKDTFTLTISQTSPSGGNGTLVAKITGRITTSATSHVHVVFNSSNQVIVLGGVTYTITTPNFTANFGAVTSLNGNVNAPEPAASGLLGFASLGLMGMTWFSRKRIMGV